MHRFFVVQGLVLQNVHLVSRQTNGPQSRQMCTFCNIYHRKSAKPITQLHVRNRTTLSNIELHTPIRKRIKRRSKKYAELLEVSDQMTSNRKAFVKNLNANDLSILVDQPDITMDKLHKISDHLVNKTKSVQQHVSFVQPVTSELSTMNDKTVFDVEDSTCSNCTVLPTNGSLLISSEEHENDLSEKKLCELQLEQNENIKEKIPLDKKQITVETSSVDMDIHDPNHVVSNLLPYMQVYARSGLLNKAYKVLIAYRGRKDATLACAASVKLYNIVMEGYASRGDLQKVLDVYALLKKDSIKPIPQSYAAILEAFITARKGGNNNELLKNITSEMMNHGISFNDLLDKTYLTDNQEQNLLEAIRLLKPEFQPVFSFQNVLYNCKLLNDIKTCNNIENPAEGLFSIEKLRSLLKEQIEIEGKGEISVKSVEKHSRDMKLVNTCRKKIERLEKHWEQVASLAFDRNLYFLKQKEYSTHNIHKVMHPFLQVIDKKHYVNGILREIRNIALGSDVYSSALPSLYIGLGEYIQKIYLFETMKRDGSLTKLVNVYHQYLNWYLNPSKRHENIDMNNRIAWKVLEHEMRKQEPIALRETANWSKQILKNIGKFLYGIILNDIRFSADMTKHSETQLPVFYTLFRSNGAYLVEQIKSHPLLSKLYKDSQPETITFETSLMPSLCPPKPWISIDSGGYCTIKLNLMRTVKHSMQPYYKLQSVSPNHIYPVLDSLNQLSSIPWTINSPVLDVLLEVFQSNTAMNMKVSPFPFPFCSPSDKINNQDDKIQLFHAKRKRSEMYSIWCDTLYKLSLANHFRNRTFWLPHNLDFRGRVYPVPPHLTHLGSDMARSLLLFAKKKPLGPDGLNWLKLHIINLTGFMKKVSVNERIDYANKNLEKILDSAERPLTGKKWWTTSDEPWQTLAACVELAAALKTPNPEEYESGFPIHQDGSCNGLQHYAALGRDDKGAKSVNLYPYSEPQDVYTVIADKVENLRKIDAQNNVHIAQVLEGHISRKVIKQTVMTTVYGVTRYGAKAQIMRQLKDVEKFPAEYVWEASSYLVDKTFHSLRSMFTSAKEIQDWFTNCARIIATVYGECVEWVTPIGLPIVQPYYKSVKQLDIHKQRNAFAPNFIHSLDSTHMMLTSINSQRAGISFVSVHDCFWTHACSVATMNEICREQFVALHNEPILENLSQFFVQRYLNSTELSPKKVAEIELIVSFLSKIPKKGEFDLNNVLSSTYFFS